LGGGGEAAWNRHHCVRTDELVERSVCGGALVWPKVELCPGYYTVGGPDPLTGSDNLVGVSPGIESG